MVGLELSEDWGAEEKNSLEVNFLCGILTPELKWWLSYAQATIAYPGCQGSLDVQDEKAEHSGTER